LYRSSSGIGIRRYFYEQQVGPQLTYLSEFQDLVEQEHDLLVQQSRRRDAEDATLQSAQHSDRFSSVLHDRWSEPFDVPIFASRAAHPLKHEINVAGGAAGHLYMRPQACVHVRVECWL
jgi:hypothetical protein